VQYDGPALHIASFFDTFEREILRRPREGVPAVLIAKENGDRDRYAKDLQAYRARSKYARAQLRGLEVSRKLDLAQRDVDDVARDAA
jgi:hypothetical protein